MDTTFLSRRDAVFHFTQASSFFSHVYVWNPVWLFSESRIRALRPPFSVSSFSAVVLQKDLHLLLSFKHRSEHVNNLHKQTSNSTQHTECTMVYLTDLLSFTQISFVLPYYRAPAHLQMSWWCLCYTGCWNVWEETVAEL